MEDPRLSIVVPARNDNYGGDFLTRFQIFADNVLGHARELDAPVELVVVEWNPPADRKRLVDAVDWPELGERTTVRLIEVPPDVHAEHENADRIGLFEYKAKNVGVRRCRAPHVLATNADIVYTRSLFEAISSGDLRDDAFYRVDRHDVRAVLEPGMTPAEHERLASENVVRVHSAYGTVPAAPTERSNRAVFRNYLRKLNPVEAWRWFKMKFIFQLHTGAPGDFTLASRESWTRLRGYPELPTQRHIDTYLCVQAMASGLEQVVLEDPMRIYHQEHGSAEMASRPQTDYEDFWQRTNEMLSGGEPELLNDDGWGLAGRDLPEKAVTA